MILFLADTRTETVLSSVKPRAAGLINERYMELKSRLFRFSSTEQASAVGAMLLDMMQRQNSFPQPLFLTALR